MSLEHAILGLLNYEPMSGYDLKKMIDVSISHFWPADQSQIYRTLTRMEQEGWLTVEIIPQDARPPRKVYHLTDAGRTEFMRWLAEPLPEAEIRISWLVQIFFAGRLGDDAVITLLESQANIYRKRLQRFTDVPEENQREMATDPPRDRFFWMLTVDYGVMQSIAHLRWLEEVINRVRRQDYRLPTIES